LPKTKHEIQALITAELRRFTDCEGACGVVVVAIDAETSGTTWTVSRYNRGESDAYACDRAALPAALRLGTETLRSIRPIARG
ncbi:MAG TPA: hypothetical protein VGF60_19235, partial [Xanthobacteraceae bacterium]